MTALRTAGWALGTTVAAAWLAGCGTPADDPNARWRFGSPQLVTQRVDGALRSAWPVATLGGRNFLVLTVARADGTSALNLVERNGTTWTAPVTWAVPSGASGESVQWTTSDPAPAVLSLTTGAFGPVLYVRRFVNEAWTAPEPVTLQNVEPVVTAAMAAGADGTLQVAYAVTGGSCANGMQVRHRARGTAGWSAYRFINDSCGLDGVSLAVDPSALDPVLVMWTGPSIGSVPGATDVIATSSATGNAAAEGDGGTSMAMFRPPFRVLTGDNRGVMAVALGGGRFLASWSLTTTSPASPGTGVRRAAFDTYGIERDTWDTANTGWYPTSGSPWLVALPKGGGALAFGNDGTQARAQVVMRQWASPAQPSVSRSVITTPSGDVSSLRALLTNEGTVQASWVESQDGGSQRLLWSVALPVTPGDDAGAR